MYYRARGLLRAKLPNCNRDTVYVGSGQRPYWVPARDHFPDEVLQFSSGLIIGHYPNSNSETILNYNPTLCMFFRQRIHHYSGT